MAGSKKTSSSWQGGIADRFATGEQGPSASHGGTTPMTSSANKTIAAAAAMVLLLATSRVTAVSAHPSAS